jgi:hypothetical protein
MLVKALSPIAGTCIKIWPVLRLHVWRLGDLEPLEIRSPCWSLGLRRRCDGGESPKAEGFVKGMRLLMMCKREIAAGLKSLKVRIEQAIICHRRSEALSGMLTGRSKTVLLERTIDIGVLFEGGERVRRPTHCLGHVDGWMRGLKVRRVEELMVRR